MDIVEDNVDENNDSLNEWSEFNIPEQILKALLEKGFTKPTVIQKLSLLPAILGRKDILGAAETGSGKTLAFGIPVLYGILECLKKAENGELDLDDDSDLEEEELDEEDPDSEDDGAVCVRAYTLKVDFEKPKHKLYALILTPTRELAMQVKNHLTDIAKYTNIKIAVITGGASLEKQEEALKKGPHIVVATPGRLWELLDQNEPHLSQVNNIRFLVIDETDRMLENAHFSELKQLLERINFDESKKKLRQNFVFSATLTLVHDPPKHIVEKSKKKNKPARFTPGQKLQKIISILGMTDPKVIDCSQQTVTAEKLLEARIFCSHEDKDHYLYYFLLRHPGRTIIFCNSIDCVLRLVKFLNILKLNPLGLHSSMNQKHRFQNLESFKKNSKAILIASDVAARGLDIPGIEHVVHYQVPKTSESYVHRSGRTARGTSEGLTLVLCDPLEMPDYNKLIRTLNRKRDLPEFPVEMHLFMAIKERVKVAHLIERVELHEKKSNSKINWFQKAARECDMIVDDPKIPKQRDIQEVADNRRFLKKKRSELNQLLAQKVTLQNISNRCISTTVLTDASKPVESNTSAVDLMKSVMAGKKDQLKRRMAKRLSQNKPLRRKAKKKRKVPSNIE
nr:PREDICTED: ATP-dependent RNA helicase DDX24 [Bemisia tabaci]